MNGKPYSHHPKQTPLEAANARISSLEDDLKFMERWAVHHGTKSHMTAENALSIIQHYPPISAITKSYADGKIPDTFNPFARITELEAQLEAVKRSNCHYTIHLLLSQRNNHAKQ